MLVQVGDTVKALRGKQNGRERDDSNLHFFLASKIYPHLCKAPGSLDQNEVEISLRHEEKNIHEQMLPSILFFFNMLEPLDNKQCHLTEALQKEANVNKSVAKRVTAGKKSPLAIVYLS